VSKKLGQISQDEQRVVLDTLAEIICRLRYLTRAYNETKAYVIAYDAKRITFAKACVINASRLQNEPINLPIFCGVKSDV
jgi:hypothetical protein